MSSDWTQVSVTLFMTCVALLLLVTEHWSILTTVLDGRLSIKSPPASSDSLKHTAAQKDSCWLNVVLWLDSICQHWSEGSNLSVKGVDPYSKLDWFVVNCLECVSLDFPQSEKFTLMGHNIKTTEMLPWSSKALFNSCLTTPQCYD